MHITSSVQFHSDRLNSDLKIKLQYHSIHSMERDNPGNFPEGIAQRSNDAIHEFGGDPVGVYQECHAEFSIYKIVNVEEEDPAFGATILTHHELKVEFKLPDDKPIIKQIVSDLQGTAIRCFREGKKGDGLFYQGFAGLVEWGTLAQ